MQPKNNTDEPIDEKNEKRDKAADVVRGQLDSLYDQKHDEHREEQAKEPAQTPAPQPASGDPAQHMNQYHAQWQDYYQKYYERYYVGHLHQAIQEHEQSSMSEEERRAMEVANLREKIALKAKTSAKKARKSRHFIPIFSAITVALIVAFMQYNQVIMATILAYVSPGAINPNNIIVDPNADVRVDPAPRLVIPKINVDVPVVYGVGYDQRSQLEAMKNGIAHFSIPGANSVPGQLGNTVLSGHSSNDLFDPGDYKFIFAQLDKMEKGDTVYVNYESIRYTYTITKKEVVLPTQVNKLIYPTKKPVLTLITCTPLGTAEKRLLVTAEQVAPDPSKAKAADTSSGGGEATFAGDGPTLLERLFGAN